MSSLENAKESENPRSRATPIKIPSPLVLSTPAASHIYFEKLPPLSPRSMKNFNMNHHSLPQMPRRASGAETYSPAPIQSAESSSSSSDHFSYVGQDPSEESISHADDINFFLQVVAVFREYVSDQIQVLEGKSAANQAQLEILKKEQKKVEVQENVQENQLSRDIARLVSLLHQKHAQLKDTLKKENCDVIGKIREQAEQCRRNTKLIAGILSFAKRIRNESSESLKENAVRELKQRLTAAGELVTPSFVLPSERPSRIDMERMASAVEALSLDTLGDDKVVQENGFPQNLAPIISAAHSHGDITSSAITVRWQCQDDSDVSFELQWSFVLKMETIEKRGDCTDTCYVIKDLPSNCDVRVKVRRASNDNLWSEAALFQTRPAPARFCFDANTAHLKLALSPDCSSVSYCGEETTRSSPKSPGRFTFALNVLGNIFFFSGRHYWEFQVNRDGWAAGVAYQGVPRNSWLGSNDSSWILHYNAAKFEYKARHAGQSFDVNPQLSGPKHYLRSVGIYLDYEAGVISFVDPATQDILHTYMVGNFKEPLSAAANPFYHCNSVTLVTGLDVPTYLLPH